jgi:hypothetical protein
MINLGILPSSTTVQKFLVFLIIFTVHIILQLQENCKYHYVPYSFSGSKLQEKITNTIMYGIVFRFISEFGKIRICSGG